MPDEVKIGALGQIAICGESKLMLWHKPTLKSTRLLKQIKNVTMIVTAQAVKEKPEAVA